MGGKGSNTTQNIERPLSQEELALYETQNEQLKKGIAIAQQQEDRAQRTQQIYEDNFLPMEVNMGGVADPAAEKKYNDMLDNQMPRYAEDTSGVMNAPMRQSATSSGKGVGNVSQSIPGHGKGSR